MCPSFRDEESEYDEKKCTREGRARDWPAKYCCFVIGTVAVQILSGKDPDRDFLSFAPRRNYPWMLTISVDEGSQRSLLI